MCEHLGLVMKQAHHFSRYGVGFEDLVSEGLIGLVESLEKFDPARGNTFGQYAVWQVRARMRRFSFAQRRNVRLPSNREGRIAIAKMPEAERVLMRRGIEPTSHAVAELLEISLQTVEDVRTAVRSHDITIDNPDPDERGRVNHNHLLTHDQLPGPTAEEPFEHAMAVQEALSVLTDRQRRVLELHVMAEDELALRDIGKMLNCSGERVRQIQITALEKLRKRLEQQGVSHA